MTTTQRAAAAVLIYVPGLGHCPENTAERVADVVARSLDRERAGRYQAQQSAVSAPRGLRVGKTVTGPDGEPVLEVFELDYRHRLEDLDPEKSRQPRPPSLLHAGTRAIAALLLLLAALRRPAKTRNAKAQLALGFAGTAILLLGAAVTILAAMAAMGLLEWLPAGLQALAWTDEVSASTVALGSGAGTAALWARARPFVLIWSGKLSELVRYVTEEQHRNGVALTLDDAVDGLRDDGWSAPVHLLAYSFGGIVVLDALYPADAGDPDTDGHVSQAIASLVTVGCPADAVRLYRPQYFAGRTPRLPDLDWVNVYIPADVFGSNFHDGDDGQDSASAPRADIGGQVPDSRSYTGETLSWLTLLRLRGLRSHAGYWNGADGPSCFPLVMDRWVRPARSTVRAAAERQEAA